MDHERESFQLGVTSELSKAFILLIMESSSIKKIPVLVSGALGRMGSEVVRAISKAQDTFLVAAIDTSEAKQGLDIGTELGLAPMEVAVTSDLEGSLCSVSQQFCKDPASPGAVLVDFTHPSCAFKHTRTAIAYGVNPVIGTTGLTPQQLQDLNQFAEKSDIGVAVIPNFSLGMVLLQQAAAAAARFYSNAELTELHHNKKADAPSGTCIKTAEMIEELGKSFNSEEIEEHETIEGSRGGLRPSGLRVHSIRLPGLVAHQEVMFGAPGEVYTLRHDTIDRASYMPGVLITVRKVRQMKGLVYGLERII